MSLFKYQRPDSIRFLVDLTVRFSPPSGFNDPFELLPNMQMMETEDWMREVGKNQIRARLASGSNISRHQAEQDFFKYYRDRMKTNKTVGIKAARQMVEVNRIFCLSRCQPDDPAALLMWAHYTKDHQGFVVEFDEGHPWIQGHKFQQGEQHDFKEVEYLSDRAGWNGLIPADEFLNRKSEHWFYEQEVRLIRFQNDPAFIADGIVPIPADLIRSVTLGVNCDENVETTLRDNAKLNHVRIRRASLHADKFSLIVNPAF